MIKVPGRKYRRFTILAQLPYDNQMVKVVVTPSIKHSNKLYARIYERVGHSLKTTSGYVTQNDMGVMVFYKKMRGFDSY